MSATIEIEGQCVEVSTFAYEEILRLRKRVAELKAERDEARDYAMSAMSAQQAERFAEKFGIPIPLEGIKQL
jgi:hypothetical protein